jgi:hypothetical protein
VAGTAHQVPLASHQHIDKKRYKFFVATQHKSLDVSAALQHIHTIVGR